MLRVLKSFLFVFWLLLPLQVWATTTLYVDTDATSPTHPTYSSLEAAITYLQGYNGGALDDDFVIECTGATADSTPVVIENITTTTTYNLTIKQAATDEHGGTWNTNYYRVVMTTNDYAIIIESLHVNIDGLQVEVQDDKSCIRIASVPSSSGNEGLYYFTNNIIRSTSLSNNYDKGIAIDDTYLTVYAINNIIYGFDNFSSDAAISTESKDYNTLYAYNNIFYDCNRGILAGTETNTNVYAVNNAVIDASTDFDGTYTTLDYNAGDDGSGTNAVTPTDWDAVFNDYANYDFTLIANSDLIDAGYDLSATFSTDINGDTRSGTWEIGVYNYGATASGTQAKYYNGSSWIDATPYRYDGSSWIEATENRYTGSAWE